MSTRVFNTEELEKIYRLVADIVKSAKQDDYQYVYIGPNGAHGTDSYRLGVYREITNYTLIAISYQVIEAIKVIKPNQMRVTNEDRRIICELLDKNSDLIVKIIKDKSYTNIPEFSEIDREGENYVDYIEMGTKELKEALTEIDKFGKNCIFEVKNGKLTLRATDKIGTEKVVEIYRIKATAPIRIALKIKFILKYLNRLNSMSVKMYYRNPYAFVRFTGYKETYEYTIMPLILR